MPIKFLSTYRILLFVVLLITIIIYLKTISFSFVNWDDDENIRTNIHYKELSIANITYHFQHSRYKAIAIWSFMFDNTLFGDKSGMYHMHNLILHLANILLLFILIFKITKKETVALIAATLFALHPSFVEPVAWITGRKDLIFVFYVLLSVLSYRQFLLKKNNVLWLLLSAIFVYLASLAKIQAFTLPLIFLGLDWFYDRKISFLLFFEKLIFVLLLIDLWYISGILISGIVFIYYFKKYFLGNRKSTEIIYWYLIISFCLITFFIKYIIKTESNNTSGFLLYLFIYIIMGIILFLGLKNGEKIVTKISLLSPNFKISIIIIPIIILLLEKYDEMILNIQFINKHFLNLWTVKPGNETYFSFFERLILAPNALLYYISRFFLISPQNPMVAYPEHLNSRLPANMVTQAVIVYIIFIILVFLLIKYFRKNKITIFGFIWFIASISIVLQIIPIEGRVLAADRYAYPSYIGLFIIFGVFTDYMLQRRFKNQIIAAFIIISMSLSIVTFINLDTWKNSISLWSKALKVKPANHYAMYSLSIAYFTDKKNPEKALAEIDKAIELKDNDFQYYNNRGRIKFAMYDFKGALEDFNNSILLDSNSFASFNNRGAVKQQLCLFKEALSDYDKALKLKSDYVEAQTNQSKVLRLIMLDSLIMNNNVISTVAINEIIEFINNVSQNYINEKQFDKASEYLNRGILIAPKTQAFHEKLAVMYQLNKDYEKSLAAYNNGLENLPENATLQFGRAILYLDTGDTIKACKELKYVVNNGFPEAKDIIEKVCTK